MSLSDVDASRYPSPERAAGGSLAPQRTQRFLDRIHKIVPTSPLFVVFCGKKGLEAGGGTAASPSTQGREAAAPPAHANLGAMVLATKNTKSAFFSAFSAISAVKNNAAEVFVFNRKERKDRKELSSSCFGQDYRIYKIERGTASCQSC